MQLTDARTLSLPGGQVFGLAEYGDPRGLPVLALHGAPACRLMFAGAHQAARKAGLRLIAPDRPGYGLTPLDQAPSLESRADWLERVVNVLGLERFAILAVSGGGPYGVALAARLGGRITALGLVSPMGPLVDFLSSAPHAKSAVPFLPRRLFLHLTRRSYFPPLTRAGVRFYMAMPRGVGAILPVLVRDPDAEILRRPEVRALLLPMTQEALRSGADGFIQDLKIFGEAWEVDFCAITAPGILWQGTGDRVVPVGASRFLAAQLSNCDFRELKGAGHFWVFAQFDQIVGELRKMILADLKNRDGSGGRRQT